MWMKYRYEFSSGPKPWRWLFLSEVPVDSACADSRLIESYLLELALEYSWSEHYRGITWELVEDPPLEAMREALVDAEHRLRTAIAHARSLQDEAERLLKARRPRPSPRSSGKAKAKPAQPRPRSSGKKTRPRGSGKPARARSR